jgi:hypothetical protein
MDGLPEQKLVKTIENSINKPFQISEQACQSLKQLNDTKKSCLKR